MRTTVIANNKNYEVRHIEFIAPAGWTVSSFYQVVKSSSICIGCSDSGHEALLWLQNPQLLEDKFIEKPSDFFLGEKILIGLDELVEGALK
ncbi:MAG: hypothetical protein AAGC78_06770 [Cellvibrio sp.]|uniref:hypothetical protein n=1 Tax=Cellvibrio sp. TaxID=1965322 RepID=UPI0031A511F6